MLMSFEIVGLLRVDEALTGRAPSRLCNSRWCADHADRHG
ncbi:hypothetical protein G155_00023 [Mycobacterium sp. VKM Ac-1817D]|nr:hypothetical protein G155_00023 [Mycobacterium sp. VKM Ac-1817D]